MCTRLGAKLQSQTSLERSQAFPRQDATVPTWTLRQASRRGQPCPFPQPGCQKPSAMCPFRSRFGQDSEHPSGTGFTHHGASLALKPPTVTSSKNDLLRGLGPVGSRERCQSTLSLNSTRTSDVCCPVCIGPPRCSPSGPPPLPLARLASPYSRGFGLVHGKNTALFNRLIDVPSRCARLPAKCVTRVPHLTLPSWRERQQHAPHLTGEDTKAQTGWEAGSGHRRESDWAGTRAWLSGLWGLTLHPCGVTAPSSSLQGAEKKRVCYHDIDSCFYR